MANKIDEITQGSSSIFIVENDKVTLFFKTNFLPNSNSIGYINRVGSGVNEYLKDVFGKGLVEINKDKDKWKTEDHGDPIYSFMRSTVNDKILDTVTAKKNMVLFS